MLKYLVILGAIVNLSGSIIYIKDTLQGKTKPNKITRLIRAIAPLIASFSAFSNGIDWAALPVFMSGFGPLLIFISSFYNKKAYRKISKLDYICGGLSIIALILRAITNNPVLVISFAILSDLLAGIPTLIKARKYPETETIWGFMGGLFSASTTFFAITAFTFVQVGFSIYLIILCTSLIIGILRGKFIRKNSRKNFI